MATPQWVKKIGGDAGEMFVAGELMKRGILTALLPENFTDDDLMIGNRHGTLTGFVQVKACHPDRSKSFILRETDEKWVTSRTNAFCALVWLGATATFERPRYWLALRSEVGQYCIDHPAHGTGNWERRIYPSALPSSWENRWSLFDQYRPSQIEL